MTNNLLVRDVRSGGERRCARVESGAGVPLYPIVRAKDAIVPAAVIARLREA